MTFGTWLLAGLLLAANALPADVAPMNTGNFKIPIKLSPDPATRAKIKQLLLFVSTDRGQTWKQHAAAVPDAESFPFDGADGEYWFTVCVVNQQGQQDPENLYKATPSLKVLIDTLKPDVHVVSAERAGDEVVVKWEVKDANLDPGTMTLEYRTPESLPNVWTPVYVTAASGQASFRPGSQGAVQYRLAVRDLVENVGTATGEVPAAAVTTASAANVGATSPPPVPRPTTDASPPPPPPPPSAQPGPLPAPAGDGGFPAVRQVSQTGGRSVDQPPAWNQLAPGATVLVNTSRAGQQIASSEGAAPGPAPTGPGFVGMSGGSPVPPAPAAPVTPLPPLQIIKDRQITLSYTVRDVGPSGLGSVELWVTRDNGQTWQPAGGMANVNQLPTADAKGAAGPVQLSLPVELPGEGAYGFYIVVKSKAGLGTPPPQPGTSPRLRVEVDQTPPKATLSMQAVRNTLILSWEAEDRNLAPSPITLEWAETRGGTWQPIAGPLPNLPSSYEWHLPTGSAALPPRVYLRLTVRDTAGNVCVAETHDPILIDLSEPRVDTIQLGPAARQ
jgi:hypothetical protein